MEGLALNVKEERNYLRSGLRTRMRLRNYSYAPAFRKCMRRCVANGIPIITLAALLPLMASARMFQIVPPEELMSKSTLVFVGTVESVETSNIATSLSYPTWRKASFPWLKVDVKVSEPVKGAKKGEIVNVMMLSIINRGNQPMINAPNVLEPDKGDIFLFCLSPTTMTNSFAALTAPFNEFLSILVLHRAHEVTSGHRSRDSGRQLLSNDQRFKPIWNLANDSGEINSGAVSKLKETYAAEIQIMSTNRIVYLEWEARTNSVGWVNDAPKRLSATNSSQK